MPDTQSDTRVIELKRRGRVSPGVSEEGPRDEMFCCRLVVGICMSLLDCDSTHGVVCALLW